jgi:D-sedoheptulose 7-phosphate isomerase
MGFGPPEGDAEVAAALALLTARGAMTFALPGKCGSYALEAVTRDPFIHQEMVEIFYHTLWETVHVFLSTGNLGKMSGNRRFSTHFSARRNKRRTTSSRMWPHPSR